ncbi:hypothetical protein RNAN_2008 [Rheinheimera nanhaiensis E407-8]|uniref:Uncharacterized protein n=1 Tax=Rheinheimera nanhaiensis E407-8 TaxID=562729 RepID=I1DY90_9GAMM|nr:hypothetical protein RNAN_2008 [Rheinheimera nanhaiensis E407-8]
MAALNVKQTSNNTENKNNFICLPNQEEQRQFTNRLLQTHKLAN